MSSDIILASRIQHPDEQDSKNKFSGSVYKKKKSGSFKKHYFQMGDTRQWV